MVNTHITWRVQGAGVDKGAMMNKYEAEFIEITKTLLDEGFNPLEVLKDFYEDKVIYKGLSAAGENDAPEIDGPVVW